MSTLERPFFERSRLLGSSRGHAFFAVLIAGASLAYWGATRDRAFLQTVPMLAVGSVLIGVAVRLGHRLIVGWTPVVSHFARNQEEAERRWRDLVDRSARSGRPYMLAGLAVIPVALPSFWLGGYFTGLSWGERGVLGTMIAVAAFYSGYGLWGIHSVGRLVRELGSFQITVEHHDEGVMAIGDGVRNTYLMAASIWVAIAISGSWTADVARLAPVVYIGPPSLFVIVGSFVWCQLPLHRRMVAFKRQRLFELDRVLDELRPSSAGDLDAERRAKLAWVNEEIGRVDELPEWPFRRRWLAQVSVTALLPALPAVRKAIALLT